MKKIILIISSLLLTNSLFAKTDYFDPQIVNLTPVEQKFVINLNKMPEGDSKKVIKDGFIAKKLLENTTEEKVKKTNRMRGSGLGM